MKNRIITALLFIINGLLISLIPTKLFPVCSSEKMKMACFYTEKAEVGLGIIVAVLGVVVLLSANKYIRVGISLSQIAIASLVLLYPLKLIGLCKMETMSCVAKTKPALIVAGTLLIFISVVNVIYLLGSKNGETVKN
jgi:hypothetical protein